MNQQNVHIALISLVLIQSTLILHLSNARTMTKQVFTHPKAPHDRIIQSLENLLDHYQKNVKSLKYVEYIGLLEGKGILYN